MDYFIFISMSLLFVIMTFVIIGIACYGMSKEIKKRRINRDFDNE